jgi:hypothetical protein
VKPLLAAISKARAGVAEADRTADAPPPDLTEAIDELKPLLRECYELGRKENPVLRQATATVNLSIIDDGQGGGIVEHSLIDEGSENLTSSLAECVRETMYRMKVSAPEGMGRVNVIYPIHFKGSQGESTP